MLKNILLKYFSFVVLGFYDLSCANARTQVSSSRSRAKDLNPED